MENGEMTREKRDMRYFISELNEQKMKKWQERKETWNLISELKKWRNDNRKKRHGISHFQLEQMENGEMIMEKGDAGYFISEKWRNDKGKKRRGISNFRIQRMVNGELTRRRGIFHFRIQWMENEEMTRRRGIFHFWIEVKNFAKNSINMRKSFCGYYSLPCVPGGTVTGNNIFPKRVS